MLHFGLGACFVVILDIIAMLLMPASNPEFTQARFFLVFPVFRLLFFLILLIWLAGWTVGRFEQHGVNYIFLLNISPERPVTSTSLFAVASIATGLWLVAFACFILDFKFGLLLAKTRQAQGSDTTTQSPAPHCTLHQTLTTLS